MIPAPVFTGASAGWTVRPAWHGREDRVSQPALEEQLEPAPADSVAAARARSSWELFRSRFMQDKAAVAGAIVIVILIALALAAPLFGRHRARHADPAVRHRHRHRLLGDRRGLPGRAAATRPEPGDRHHRHLHLAEHGPAGARPGALAAGARVRRGGPVPRGPPRPDHVPRAPA